jgi:hypothetical protein
MKHLSRIALSGLLASLAMAAAAPAFASSQQGATPQCDDGKKDTTKPEPKPLPKPPSAL